MKKNVGARLFHNSFRHYYILPGNIADIDSGSITSIMGQSIEAHHSAHPYFLKAVTAKRFREARDRISA